MDSIKPIVQGNDERITETIVLPVSVGQRARTLRLAYGRFYADTLTLIGDGKALVRNTDYRLVYLDATTTTRDGKEVCLFVSIINPSINSIVVTYHPYGGNAIPNDGTLDQNIAAVDYTNLKTSWANVVGRATQFAPSAHEHKWYDLYQMDDFITGLNAIVAGIEGQHIPYYQETIDRLKQMNSSRVADIDDIRNTLDRHKANTDNPHHVTATQLGYGNLPYLPPTTTNALTGDRTHLLLVKHAKSYIYDIKREDIYAHILRQDNPHRVSADNVDTYTTVEVDSKVANYVTRSVSIAEAKTLNGKSISTLHDEITRNINVESITSGVFDPSRVGQGTPSDTKVLRGDGQYVELTELFDQYTTKGNRWAIYLFPWESTYSLTESLNIVAAAYSDRNEWPVGTVVFFSNAVRVWSDTQRLGKALRIIDQVRGAVLQSDGWKLL